MFFSETDGSFEIKFHMKAYWILEMKICTNELGHMAKMSTLPIYGKNLKNFSSPEPINQLNLV